MRLLDGDRIVECLEGFHCQRIFFLCKVISMDLWEYCLAELGKKVGLELIVVYDRSVIGVVQETVVTL